METKRCGRCLFVLATTDFHKAKREKSGLQSWCKSCRKEHKKEERKEYHRNRYHSNKDNYLDWMYVRKYGISLATFKELLEEQKGVCKICSLPCTSGRQLSVDHDHLTGKVRGLLCGNCNKGLGSFKDNINLLKKAMEYLNGS